MSTTAIDDECESISMEQNKRQWSEVSTTTSETMAKRFCPTTEEMDSREDAIPHYLLSKNQLFYRIIQEVLDHPTSKDLDQLRQITFFMHKITEYRLLHDLWSVYLQSGAGVLSETGDVEDRTIHVDRRYWPNEVTSLVPLSSVERTVEENEEMVACKSIVQQHLHRYSEQIEYYQKQFHTEKDQHPMWTSKLEETLQALIEEYGLVSLQMECHWKIGLLRYQYRDEIIQRQYQQQQPTVYQVIKLGEKISIVNSL